MDEDCLQLLSADEIGNADFSVQEETALLIDQMQTGSNEPMYGSPQKMAANLMPEDRAFYQQFIMNRDRFSAQN